MVCSPEYFCLTHNVIKSHEELGNQDGVYLFRAYERLKKKDAKGGLALIDRAVSAGYPEEHAMILSAAFLNQTGYPKRAVGICEKLL